MISQLLRSTQTIFLIISHDITLALHCVGSSAFQEESHPIGSGQLQLTAGVGFLPAVVSNGADILDRQLLTYIVKMIFIILRVSLSV